MAKTVFFKQLKKSPLRIQLIAIDKEGLQDSKDNSSDDENDEKRDIML